MLRGGGEGWVNTTPPLSRPTPLPQSCSCSRTHLEQSPPPIGYYNARPFSVSVDEPVGFITPNLKLSKSTVFGFEGDIMTFNTLCLCCNWKQCQETIKLWLYLSTRCCAFDEQKLAECNKVKNEVTRTKKQCLW